MGGGSGAAGLSSTIGGVDGLGAVGRAGVSAGVRDGRDANPGTSGAGLVGSTGALVVGDEFELGVVGREEPGVVADEPASGVVADELGPGVVGWDGPGVAGWAVVEVSPAGAVGTGDVVSPGGVPITGVPGFGRVGIGWDPTRVGVGLPIRVVGVPGTPWVGVGPVAIDTKRVGDVPGEGATPNIDCGVPPLASDAEDGGTEPADPSERAPNVGDDADVTPGVTGAEATRESAPSSADRSTTAVVAPPSTATDSAAMDPR